MLGVDAQLTWYAARASGMVTWALVTAGVLWGLALSTRLIRRKGAPAWTLDLHRFLGTLSIVFLGVHLFAIWVDNYVHFGARELFVPMTSKWRPGAVAWGIVATYLLVAIQVTSWALRFIPRRLWRAVHLTSFILFITATIHGFTAGADNENIMVQWAALTGTLMLLALGAVRLNSAARSPRGARRRPPVATSHTHPAERPPQGVPAGRP
jgi:predicted ferric reductase